MTREEYREICSKYSAYLKLCGDDSCYIRGCVDLAEYQVTDFSYDLDERIITDRTIGKVYINCFCTDSNEIMTTATCMKTKDKNEFEKYILMFIKNYKIAKMNLKIKDLNKDFE
jgi:hypothetical protein